MSLQKHAVMRISGSTVKIIAPVNHYSSPSYPRRSRSDALPSIAGVSLGIQNSSTPNSMPAKKITKSVPIRKTNSISTQTSSDEEYAYVEKIKMLQKENLQLKAKLKEHDAAISNLRQLIQEKNTEYAKSMETEKKGHKATKKHLEECQNLVQDKILLIEKNTKHYEQVNQELKKQYEEALAAVKKQNQADMSRKDETIVKLKNQISDIFKDKSWEHQHQLEELRKELNRLSDEAQLLRIKLKREEIYKRVCGNCKTLTENLEDAIVQLRVKDEAIEELQSVCKKFESQLFAHDPSPYHLHLDIAKL
ncbi:myosin-7-like isoform X2 [Pleurodeles waltl]|uniref:myosin-7-like isoform X2 n=1 Tax=Pleurodeles waltl TaxID=8319 RepID=UPI0037097202